MSYLISVNRLKSRLENNQDNTVLVDVRFQLGDPQAGRKAYLEEHIPGAVYMDLEKDLSGKKEKHGGSHPLPDIDMLAAKISNIGIDHDTTVVVYDKENDMFAARFWWLLHYMGHNKVYVLEGGYDCWKSEGNETTSEIPQLQKKHFSPSVREDEKVNIETVKQKLTNENTIVIDSRAKERYLGKTEPMYAKAGHIPGAKNFFWKELIKDNQTWKKGEELAEHFKSLPKNKEIIVSCGSGVSACPNILALKSAGYSNVKLYPGSFSDWISYEENPVETKDE
ncbi:sulfurtransferase [Virgibacillus halodenitrificans]|uniref:sulfurtransferase n=1 Tax=Virgibacillus halodenitrificans TaxID=1482 RepID=UPI001FB2BED3|nr:sulfurtransferase [Virgibacillus halodenitrificans]MCJ0930312.1 sulfurtransferase [Virgibacillus halodenitrificans]